MSITPTHTATKLHALVNTEIPHLQIDAFNRTICWKPKDERLLIDSIMQGYYIPEIQISHDNYLIDGQHRLNTIYRFFNNKFSVDVTENTGKSSLYYKDLTSKLKSQVDNYRLSIAEFPNMTTEQRKESFTRVNSGSSFKGFERLWLVRGSTLISTIIRVFKHVDVSFLNFANLSLEELCNEESVAFVNLQARCVNIRKALLEIIPFCVSGLKATVDKECRMDVYGKKKLLNFKWTDQQVNHCISLLNSFSAFVSGYQEHWSTIRNFNQIGSLIMYSVIHNQTNIMVKYLGLVLVGTNYEDHKARVLGSNINRAMSGPLITERFNNITSIVEEHENREHL
jgi:hypothetical protein